MFMTDAACQPAAIYPRVSSDRQKENHTIASQTAALIFGSRILLRQVDHLSDAVERLAQDCSI